jgi:hypothetical protein
MKFIFSLFVINLIFLSQVQANSALDIVNKEPLTEKEQKEDEEYIHQGLADKKVQELCKNGQGGFKDICDEDKAGFKSGSGFSKVEEMLPLVAQAMSAFGATQSKITSHTHTDKGAAYKVDGKTEYYKEGETVPDGAKPETESKHDWCATIGTVGETAAQALQKSKNDTTKKNFDKTKKEAKQAASFRALAQTHRDMADGSRNQFYLWTGVSGCYVAYVAQAQFQGDTMIYVKMGFSTVMATFYKLKQNAHKKRAKILENMAKRLPQAGECSPISDPTCFCEEESSKTSDPSNFAAVCLPKALADRAQEETASFCVDKNGKPDPKCKCKRSRSCIDREFKIGAANLGISPTLLRDPLATLRPISNGFGDGSIGAAANRNLNLARRTLKKFKPKSQIPLNKKQKKLADALRKRGIPAAVSALAASKSRGGLDVKPSSGFASLGTGRPQRLGIKRPVKAVKNPNFRSGRGSKPKRTRGGRRGFGRRGKNNKKGGIQEYRFGNDAFAEAEVSKEEGRSIFDIISYRYKKKAAEKQFD